MGRLSGIILFSHCGPTRVAVRGMLLVDLQHPAGRCQRMTARFSDALHGSLMLFYKEAAMKILASILTRRALRSCCSRWVVADCGHVEGGPGGGIVEEHEAWAVSIQRVAGRLATPLGHIKKKMYALKTFSVLEYVFVSGKSPPLGGYPVSSGSH